MSEWLGPDWKPERAKFVMTLDPVSNFLLLQIDPGFPNAWRAEPYFSQIKRWSAAAGETGRQVILFIGKSATVVFPDREMAMGVIAAGERLHISRTMTPGGPRIDVTKGPSV